MLVKAPSTERPVHMLIALTIHCCRNMGPSSYNTRDPAWDGLVNRFTNVATVRIESVVVQSRAVAQPRPTCRLRPA